MRSRIMETSSKMGNTEHDTWVWAGKFQRCSRLGAFKPKAGLSGPPDNRSTNDSSARRVKPRAFRMTQRYCPRGLIPLPECVIPTEAVFSRRREGFARGPNGAIFLPVSIEVCRYPPTYLLDRSSAGSSIRSAEFSCSAAMP